MTPSHLSLRDATSSTEQILFLRADGNEIDSIAHSSRSSDHIVFNYKGHKHAARRTCFVSWGISEMGRRVDMHSAGFGLSERLHFCPLHHNQMRRATKSTFRNQYRRPRPLDCLTAHISSMEQDVAACWSCLTPVGTSKVQINVTYYSFS